MSNSTAVTRKENDDIQVGVEVTPKITDDDNTGNNIKLTKENSDDSNNSCVPANNRNSFNLGRFPSSSSSPGSTPIKSAPSTPNRLFRSESSSSVIGLLPVAASQTFDNPPSPVTKVPPSPTTCVDAGPTVGVLEPEMFTGIETIVVPSEPDLVHYNSVELSTVGEERAKFQFSTNNNNVTFHRRFPQVDPDERLINYYSCALQADILLQGYLYITENYFAFYSNILGLYKTKLLVPVCDVRDITKEKTAIIIPNAVGIETPEGKYVFGSLLSRESTFRLMIEVWKNTISLDTFPYDHLRPTQDPTSDNGNSSPSTPTKEDPLKTILPSASKREPGRLSITTLGPLESAVSKSSSLNRTKLIRRTKGGRQGFHHCTDSSTPETASDLDYGQEGEGSKGEVGQHRKSKSPFKDNQSSRRGKLIYDGWRRLSISIKSFRERLKSGLSTPFLHIAIIILLTYLLISTVCMIHRINLLRDLFESLTSNPQAQRILNNLQVEQIRLDLSKNMVKMDDLKSSLLHLLDSVEKVFNSNCANTKYNIFTNPSMLNTCPTKEK